MKKYKVKINIGISEIRIIEANSEQEACNKLESEFDEWHSYKVDTEAEETNE